MLCSGQGRKRAFFPLRSSSISHRSTFSIAQLLNSLSLCPLSSPLTADPACACDDDEDDLLLALAEEIGEEDAGAKADEEERVKATTKAKATVDATAKERPRPPPPPPKPATAAAAPPRQQQQQQQLATLRPLHAPVFELGGPSRRPEPAPLKTGGGPFVDLLSRLRVARPLPVSNPSTSTSSYSAPFTSSSSSSSVVEAMGAQFVRLDQLKSTLSGDVRRDGLWATAGVVTFKAARKASAASSFSSSYSSSSSSPMLQLVLADLAGTEVSLAAFGARSVDSAESLALGCVVAVIGASAKRREKKRSSSSSSSPFSLSAGDSSVLLPLGPSADYGTCGARTRDGGSCRRAVNKSECPVCDLHVTAVASRLRPGAGQGALRDSALSSHILGNKRRSDGNGGFYNSGDNSSRARGAAAARVAAADAALGLPQAREAAALQEKDPVAAVARAAAAAAGGRATHGVRLLGRNVVGRAVEQGGAEEDEEEGAEEEEVELSGGESDDEDGEGRRAKRKNSSSSGAFAAAAATEATAAEAAAAKRRRSDALLRQALTLKSSFDPNRVERSSAAGRAALAKLRAAGKEAKNGSGGGRGGGRGKEQQQQQPLSAFAAAFAAQAAGAASDENAKPEASRYGNIGEDAVLRGVGIGGSGGSGSGGNGIENGTGSLSSAIAALEAKDAVEQRAASLTKLVVRAVCCSCCRYTAEFPTKDCVARGHALTKMTAVKRWWRCGSCGSRSTTVGLRYPRHACRSCRDPGKVFAKATAGGESAAGKYGTVGAGEVVAERGALRARGHEHGFGVFG